MTCTDCGCDFTSDDSIGSHESLCQGCWERMCDREWWDAVDTVYAVAELRERLEQQ